MAQQVITRNRHEVDAEGVTLGRVATRVATLLIGKHKPTFASHIDAGDFVRVLHLQKMRFTGSKMTKKLYTSHSFWPGGIKQEKLQERWEKRPELVLIHAVKCMLPATKHRKAMLQRLTIER